MNPRPLILVVGGDALTERVCAELTATTVTKCGSCGRSPPTPDETLKAAPLAEAARCGARGRRRAHLVVALRARVLNRNIRISCANSSIVRHEDRAERQRLRRTFAGAHSREYAGAAARRRCFSPALPAETDRARLHPTSGARWTPTERPFGTEHRRGLRSLLGDRLDPPAGGWISAEDAVVASGPVVEQARHQSRFARDDGHLRRRTPLPHGLDWRIFRRRMERLNPRCCACSCWPRSASSLI